MFLTTIWAALQQIYGSLAIWRLFPRHSAQTQKIEANTTQAITALRNEDWTALRPLFLLPLRLLLTEILLRKAWESVLTIYGPLEDIGPATFSNYWLLHTATAPLRFKQGSVSLSLQWAVTGHLIGLRVIPLASNRWKPPSYATSEDITETKLSLGRGIYKVGATLTLPTNPQPKTPCVILIAGSGPTDRDSTIRSLKPFKDLAYGLSSSGIAVCRFDKVTYTHGLWLKLLRRNRSMTLTDEYVYHVLDAVRQVRKHPGISEVFLLGHSLGAWPAAKITALDSAVAGCVLMACPAEQIYRCAVRQMRYLMAVNGGLARASNTMGEELVKLERQAEVADGLSPGSSVAAGELPFGIGPAYWLEGREFNPLGYSEHLSRKPLLVLQGGRDYQATMKDDYARYYETFRGCVSVEFRVYESLNHLFVAGEGLSVPAEYDKSGNVDAKVVDDIVLWVRRQVAG
ncbi:alpha/beta-hydrolase [Aspergillus heteromorphus CBS 117.55]|uniref:Alpha/beta-hydrolase n=1 Tax=Aspergillus heteromorphus CBS 117.55 TaxID=1448321 RepID=A0A317WTI8_9EURO|nr:alpha/beta-hydrolase [Aspergillus heteromorphus CBS 117.55]PWY89723.1 alpha/beta-hydrolase [Aspergillus heteromorphus CBS 117.55]